ncbi:hypothetical protein PG985_003513 [Apiospora marii]|uniref:uncharacterized protein n=1 Tax=Apiospora marii TaxID=335849 RepID=UPI00312D7966
MQFQQLLFATVGALMASTGAAAPPPPPSSFWPSCFLANQTQADVDDVTRRFLLLKDNCLKNGKPYILSVSGGTNNSPTHRNKGFTHSWINTFASAEDRDYYQFEDPYHLNFEASMVYHLKDAYAFDFLPAKYQTLQQLAAENLVN